MKKLKRRRRSRHPKKVKDLGGKVAFEFYAPSAKSVSLAGSFNEWDVKKCPMTKLNEGKWRVDLDLKPGRYEYRYYVDGNWENDPNVTAFVPNPFGTWNCVIEIK